MKKATHKKSKSKHKSNHKSKKSSHYQYYIQEQQDSPFQSRAKDAYYPNLISTKSKKQKSPSIITKTRCAYSLPNNLSFLSKVNGIERTLTMQDRKIKYLEARLKQKTCFSMSAASGRSATKSKSKSKSQSRSQSKSQSKSKSKKKQSHRKTSSIQKSKNSFIKPSIFFKQNDQIQQINKFEEEVAEKLSQLRNSIIGQQSNKNSQIFNSKQCAQTYLPIEENFGLNKQFSSLQPSNIVSARRPETNFINSQNQGIYNQNSQKKYDNFYISPNAIPTQSTDTDQANPRDLEILQLKRKALHLESLVEKHDQHYNQLAEGFNQKLWVYSNRVLELEKENQVLMKDKERANDLERKIAFKEKQIKTLENYYKEKLEVLANQNKLLRNKVQFANIENQFSLQKSSQFKLDDLPLSEKRSQNFTFA